MFGIRRRSHWALFCLTNHDEVICSMCGYELPWAYSSMENSTEVVTHAYCTPRRCPKCGRRMKNGDDVIYGYDRIDPVPVIHSEDVLPA